MDGPRTRNPARLKAKDGFDSHARGDILIENVLSMDPNDFEMVMDVTDEDEPFSLDPITANVCRRCDGMIPANPTGSTLSLLSSLSTIRYHGRDRAQKP